MPDTPVANALGTVLDKVFAFIDKPWKAVALIFLIIAGGLVYVIYLQRHELTQALLHHNEQTAPVLQTAKFPSEGAKLLLTAHADSVSIYSIEMNTNTLALKYNKSVEGVGMPSPTPRPVILNAQDATLFLTLFQERALCANPEEIDRPGSADALARGIRRFCFVLIPPVPPYALGFIMLGWRTALSPLQEREAVLNAQATAEILGM